MNPMGGSPSGPGPSKVTPRRVFVSAVAIGVLAFGVALAPIAAGPVNAAVVQPSPPASSSGQPSPHATSQPSVGLAPAEKATPSTLPPEAAIPPEVSEKIAPAVRPKMPEVKIERGVGGASMGQGLKRLKANLSTQDNDDNTNNSRLEDSSVATQSSFVGSEVPSSFPPMAAWMAPGVQGMDVSGWQASVNWQDEWNAGARFAYVKATEGIDFTSSGFSSQYVGSANAGMIRGAYHFALPSQSSATDQADFFVNHGGGWSADGATMPPLLDIEYNPYSALGDVCYNMAGQPMVNWIRAFSNEILARTGRVPAIYTTTDWWSRCTGNNGSFSDNPLHIAAGSQWVGPMPNGWSTYSIWQYSDSGPFAGDSDAWNGDYSGLQTFAYGAPASVVTSIRAKAASNPGLGSATSGVVCGIRDGGCYQNFTAGAILWSPSTGARVSGGQIRVAYQSQGFEAGQLGYPASDETCGLTNGGCYQNYQGGAILWTATTGPQISYSGPIRTAWQSTGFETGPLGYPTSGLTCGLQGQGCRQDFEGGTILWSKASGAQVIANGPIRNAWLNAGAEASPLAYPVAGQVCGQPKGGCYQNFQGGTVSWSAASGAQIVGGEIRVAWVSAGRENGPLGYPTGPQTCGIKNGGCYQNFQNGAILWSPTTGAQLSPTGPIRTAWQQSGFENGPLGYPTGPQTCGIKNGGCYQNFQNGAILWSQATDAISIH